MPCTVRCNKLGLALPLPQLSVHDFRAEAASCPAMATASSSPAQEEPVESKSLQSLGGSKTPAVSLKLGQLAPLQVSTCSRLRCIAACRGVRFSVLYSLLCLNSSLTDAPPLCLVATGFQGEILCSPRPA